MQIRYGALALAVTAALSTQAFGDSKAASSKLRTTSHPSNTKAHFRFPTRVHAATDSVLYDQSGVAENGAPAQDFQSNPTPTTPRAPTTRCDRRRGLDGQRVQFQVGFVPSSVPPPASATYDIDVYADAGGAPGAAACAYSGLSGVLDATDTSLSVSLSSPCILSQGTYWVSLQAVLDFPPQSFWSNASGSTIGNEAVWREGGGFGTSLHIVDSGVDLLRRRRKSELPVPGRRVRRKLRPPARRRDLPRRDGRHRPRGRCLWHRRYAGPRRSAISSTSATRSRTRPDCRSTITRCRTTSTARSSGSDPFRCRQEQARNTT